MTSRCLPAFMLPIILGTIVRGCRARHKMDVAPVTGTVRCNGQLVTEGYVLFTPIPPGDADRMRSGKSAYGNIRPDGTYVLTTYDSEDGAVIGQHRVRVYKPDPEDDEQPHQDPFVCGNTERVVEVKDEDNTIELDLHHEPEQRRRR